LIRDEPRKMTELVRKLGNTLLFRRWRWYLKVLY